MNWETASTAFSEDNSESLTTEKLLKLTEAMKRYDVVRLTEVWVSEDPECEFVKYLDDMEIKPEEPWIKTELGVIPSPFYGIPVIKEQTINKNQYISFYSDGSAKFHCKSELSPKKWLTWSSSLKYVKDYIELIKNNREKRNKK